MRQAGRYLAEYRAIRATQKDFISFCLNPEKASAVTLQPIARYGFDAAIIFSDILMVPWALEQNVRFQPNSGPLLDPLDVPGSLDQKLINNIKWYKASAEKLPFKENTFDFYTISFGIRNVSNIDLTLKEAFRVLKPGGRFMCLEFSKVNNEIVDFFYEKYSKIIPLIGKYVVGSTSSYEYLVKSISEFYSQEELVKLMKKHRFSNIEYRNLSSGISAIHSGWKI